MSPTRPSQTRSGCPTCGRPVDWPGNPARPSCSVACKLIDLGGWLDETYRMPAEPKPEATGPNDRPARER